jgi:GNAT superfamily N-acetyltransferase
MPRSRTAGSALASSVDESTILSEPSAEAVTTPMTDLARTAHGNMVEAFASLPPHQARGFVRRADGVVVAVTGSPVALFNAVLPVAEPVDPQAVAQACRGLAGAGLAWSTQVREEVDDALVPVLLDLGATEDAEMSWLAMALTVLPAELDVPAEVEIRPVMDAIGLEDHRRATGGDPRLGTTWLGSGVLDDPRWTLFVGYAGGDPVARSMGFVHDGVVGVYDVGTQAPWRRRGFGSALTKAALVVGRRSGCSLATLQSTAPARHLYETLGFRPLFRYRAFSGSPAAS